MSSENKSRGVTKIFLSFFTLMLVCLLCSPICGAGEVINMKISTFFSPQHPSTKLVEEMAAELSAASDGRVVLKHYGSSSLGNPSEQVDITVEGLADMAITCCGYKTSKYPLSLVVQLPLFSDSALTGTKILMAMMDRGIFDEEFRTKILQAGLKGIECVNIGIIVCLLIITIVDVIGRYVFNTSFFDAMMISSFMLAAVNALALPRISLSREHVQVELVYQRLPRGVKFFFRSINTLLASVLFFIMSWFAFEKAVLSYQRGVYKGWMHLPEYPARFLFAAGCLLTAIVFLILFVTMFCNIRVKRG